MREHNCNRHPHNGKKRIHISPVKVTPAGTLHPQKSATRVTKKPWESSVKQPPINHIDTNQEASHLKRKWSNDYMREMQRESSADSLGSRNCVQEIFRDLPSMHCMTDASESSFTTYADGAHVDGLSQTSGYGTTDELWPNARHASYRHLRVDSEAGVTGGQSYDNGQRTHLPYYPTPSNNRGWFNYNQPSYQPLPQTSIPLNYGYSHLGHHLNQNASAVSYPDYGPYFSRGQYPQLQPYASLLGESTYRLPSMYHLNDRAAHLPYQNSPYVGSTSCRSGFPSASGNIWGNYSGLSQESDSSIPFTQNNSVACEEPLDLSRQPSLIPEPEQENPLDLSQSSIEFPPCKRAKPAPGHSILINDDNSGHPFECTFLNLSKKSQHIVNDVPLEVGVPRLQHFPSTEHSAEGRICASLREVAVPDVLVGHIDKTEYISSTEISRASVTESMNPCLRIIPSAVDDGMTTLGSGHLGSEVLKELDDSCKSTRSSNIHDQNLQASDCKKLPPEDQIGQNHVESQQSDNYSYCLDQNNLVAGNSSIVPVSGTIPENVTGDDMKLNSFNSCMLAPKDQVTLTLGQWSRSQISLTPCQPWKSLENSPSKRLRTHSDSQISYSFSDNTLSFHSQKYPGIQQYDSELDDSGLRKSPKAPALTPVSSLESAAEEVDVSMPSLSPVVQQNQYSQASSICLLADESLTSSHAVSHQDINHKLPALSPVIDFRETHSCSSSSNESLPAPMLSPINRKKRHISKDADSTWSGSPFSGKSRKYVFNTLRLKPLSKQYPSVTQDKDFSSHQGVSSFTSGRGSFPEQRAVNSLSSINTCVIGDLSCEPPTLSPIHKIPVNDQSTDMCASESLSCITPDRGLPLSTSSPKSKLRSSLIALTPECSHDKCNPKIHHDHKNPTTVDYCDGHCISFCSKQQQSNNEMALGANSVEDSRICGEESMSVTPHARRLHSEKERLNLQIAKEGQQANDDDPIPAASWVERNGNILPLVEKPYHEKIVQTSIENDSLPTQDESNSVQSVLENSRTHSAAGFQTPQRGCRYLENVKSDCSQQGFWKTPAEKKQRGWDELATKCPRVDHRTKEKSCSIVTITPSKRGMKVSLQSPGPSSERANASSVGKKGCSSRVVLRFADIRSGLKNISIETAVEGPESPHGTSYHNISQTLNPLTTSYSLSSPTLRPEADRDHLSKDQNASALAPSSQEEPAQEVDAHGVLGATSMSHITDTGSTHDDDEVMEKSDDAVQGDAGEAVEASDSLVSAPVTAAKSHQFSEEHHTILTLDMNLDISDTLIKPVITPPGTANQTNFLDSPSAGHMMDLVSPQEAVANAPGLSAASNSQKNLIDPNPQYDIEIAINNINKHREEMSLSFDLFSEENGITPVDSKALNFQKAGISGGKSRISRALFSTYSPMKNKTQDRDAITTPTFLSGADSFSRECNQTHGRCHDFRDFMGASQLPAELTYHESTAVRIENKVKTITSKRHTITNPKVIESDPTRSSYSQSSGHGCHTGLSNSFGGVNDVSRAGVLEEDEIIISPSIGRDRSFLDDSYPVEAGRPVPSSKCLYPESLVQASGKKSSIMCNASSGKVEIHAKSMSCSERKLGMNTSVSNPSGDQSVSAPADRRNIRTETRSGEVKRRQVLLIDGLPARSQVLKSLRVLAPEDSNERSVHIDSLPMKPLNPNRPSLLSTCRPVPCYQIQANPSKSDLNINVNAPLPILKQAAVVSLPPSAPLSFVPSLSVQQINPLIQNTQTSATLTSSSSQAMIFENTVNCTNVNGGVTAPLSCTVGSQSAALPISINSDNPVIPLLVLQSYQTCPTALPSMRMMVVPVRALQPQAGRMVPMPCVALPNVALNASLPTRAPLGLEPSYSTALAGNDSTGHPQSAFVSLSSSTQNQVACSDLVLNQANPVGTEWRWPLQSFTALERGACITRDNTRPSHISIAQGITRPHISMAPDVTNSIPRSMNTNSYHAMNNPLVRPPVSMQPGLSFPSFAPTISSHQLPLTRSYSPSSIYVTSGTFKTCTHDTILGTSSHHNSRPQDLATDVVSLIGKPHAQGTTNDTSQSISTSQPFTLSRSSFRSLGTIETDGASIPPFPTSSHTSTNIYPTAETHTDIEMCSSSRVSPSDTLDTVPSITADSGLDKISKTNLCSAAMPHMSSYINANLCTNISQNLCVISKKPTRLRHLSAPVTNSSVVPQNVSLRNWNVSASSFGCTDPLQGMDSCKLASSVAGQTQAHSDAISPTQSYEMGLPSQIHSSSLNRNDSHSGRTDVSDWNHPSLGPTSDGFQNISAIIPDGVKQNECRTNAGSANHIFSPSSKQTFAESLIQSTDVSALTKSAVSDGAHIQQSHLFPNVTEANQQVSMALLPSAREDGVSAIISSSSENALAGQHKMASHSSETTHHAASLDCWHLQLVRESISDNTSISKSAKKKKIPSEMTCSATNAFKTKKPLMKPQHFRMKSLQVGSCQMSWSKRHHLGTKHLKSKIKLLFGKRLLLYDFEMHDKIKKTGETIILRVNVSVTLKSIVGLLAAESDLLTLETDCEPYHVVRFVTNGTVSLDKGDFTHYEVLSAMESQLKTSPYHWVTLAVPAPLFTSHLVRFDPYFEQISKQPLVMDVNKKIAPEKIEPALQTTSGKSADELTWWVTCNKCEEQVPPGFLHCETCQKCFTRGTEFRTLCPCHVKKEEKVAVGRKRKRVSQKRQTKSAKTQNKTSATDRPVSSPMLAACEAEAGEMGSSHRSVPPPGVDNLVVGLDSDAQQTVGHLVGIEAVKKKAVRSDEMGTTYTRSSRNPLSQIQPLVEGIEYTCTADQTYGMDSVLSSNKENSSSCNVPDGGKPPLPHTDSDNLGHDADWFRDMAFELNMNLASLIPSYRKVDAQKLNDTAMKNPDESHADRNFDKNKNNPVSDANRHARTSSNVMCDMLSTVDAIPMTKCEPNEKKRHKEFVPVLTCDMSRSETAVTSPLFDTPSLLPSNVASGEHSRGRNVRDCSRLVPENRSAFGYLAALQLLDD